MRSIKTGNYFIFLVNFNNDISKIYQLVFRGVCNKVFASSSNGKKYNENHNKNNKLELFFGFFLYFGLRVSWEQQLKSLGQLTSFSSCFLGIERQSHVESSRNQAKMSNQCKNCDRDRDLNNNFVGYPSGYLTSPSNTSNNNNNSSTNNTSNRNTAASAMTNNSGSTQIKAKIMFGSVGAIKELREKEHAEKARSTQAGRRQWSNNNFNKHLTCQRHIGMKLF